MVSRRRVPVGLSSPGHFLFFIRAIAAGVPLFLLCSSVPAADKPQSSAPAGVKEQEPGLLVGQLVQADGQPVADAQVLLRGKSRREAKSDKEGRFRFEALSPGEYRIFATKDKLVSPRAEVQGSTVNGSRWGRFEPLRIEMSPGKELRLIVTSAATGQPLAGARVRLFANRWREAQTAKDGTAMLDGLLPENYRVTIEAAGHASIARQIDLSAADARLEVPIALASGGAIQGFVTDEKGKPLSGATVYYMEEGTHISSPGRKPATDAHGHFQHDGLPLNAAIEVSVNRDGYLSQRQTVALSPQRCEANLNFKLLPKPRGGSITGVVRDETGKPISGATIENHGNGSDEKRMATTDDQGRYALHDLLDSYAGYEITVRAPGRAPLRQLIKPGPPGKPARLDWTLEPGHFIHGRVVAEDGKPVAGANVGLPGDLWPVAEPQRTDERGRFEMDSLPAHARFFVTKSGFTGLQEIPLRLDSTGLVTIVLEPMGIVRGRVVDADTGKPLSHFNVWLNFARERRPSGVQWSMNGDLTYPGRHFQSKDGTFTIKDLMHKIPVEVDVAAEGYLKTVVPLVVAATADEVKTVEVALKRLDPSKLAAFSGRILDDAGRPVGGANIRLIVSTVRPNGPDDNDFNWIITKSGDLRNKGYCDQFLQAVSDSQGQFEFKHVLPDKYWQVAYWGEHVPQGRLLSDDSTRPGRLEKLTIALPRPARIEGMIDRAKYPEAGSVTAELVARSPWNRFEARLADGQRTFDIGDLPPGEYNVYLQSKPVRSKERAGMFTSRSVANQRVRLKPGETKAVKF
jgi:protocatechuate 3,4-dioxygenase beta subunit